MAAVDPQLHVGVALPVDEDVEGGEVVLAGEVGGGAVGGLLQAEGEDGVGKAPDGLHGALVVGVGDDEAALRHQLRETVEGVLDVRLVLEEVQVVLLHVQDHGHRGIEEEEGVAVLAGFQNDGVPLAHPVAGAQQGQGPADHHGGVLLRRQEDVGAHGGGGGLAVGAGDAEGVGVALHDGAPGLGPLIDGDAPGHGPGDLGIAVMDGGGADHEVAVPQILGAVALGDGDAQGLQPLDGGAVAHVGALDLQAHAPQHLRQGAHGDAADADQVDPLAGLEKILNGEGIVHHRDASFPKPAGGAGRVDGRGPGQKPQHSLTLYYNPPNGKMQRERRRGNGFSRRLAQRGDTVVRWGKITERGRDHADISAARGGGPGRGHGLLSGV